MLLCTSAQSSFRLFKKYDEFNELFCFQILRIYSARMILVIISQNLIFIYARAHYSNNKKKRSWWCFFQSFELTNRHTWRPSAKNQSSAIGSLISRKQQLECRSSLSLSGCLRPTAALISSVIILTVFAQPCWHMFHDLRRFCFNLPNTLRCGHSHWLDLLIQLVFFDEYPSPPPSLSSSLLPFHSPALLFLTVTLA